MISYRTSDAWGTGTWTVTANGHTYVYTMAGPSAYDEILAFVAWYNDPAKLWATQCGWNLQRDPATGGTLFVLHFLVIVHLAPNATAIALMGFPDATAEDMTATAPAAGTWYPLLLSVSGNYRQFDAEGDGSGVGAVRPGVAGTAHRIPTIQAAGDKFDAARLTGLAKTLASPRRAWVYDDASPVDPAWLDLSLGAVRRLSADGLSWTFDIDCCGGPV